MHDIQLKALALEVAKEVVVEYKDTITDPKSILLGTAEDIYQWLVKDNTGCDCGCEDGK